MGFPLCRSALGIALLLFGVGILPSATPIPVRSKHAMVVSAHPLASEIGVAVLRNGGNAVDAAVAVGLALAVVYPEAGNLGGGGFMLIRKRDGTATVIDFREKAPGAASGTMYIDSAGNVTDKSFDGPLAAAVPGTVSGFLEALQRYGSMSLHDLAQPALDLAKNGFVVDRHLEASLDTCWTKLSEFPATLALFSQHGAHLREGDTLRQPDLARTLGRIQELGNDGFYRGETARLIEQEMRRGGGIVTRGDLEAYHPVLREPLRGSYRGYEILAPPPPSSGGLCLLEILNISEGYDLASMGFHSSKAVHFVAEAMKRAYADRAELMGDPAFVEIPGDVLVSKSYANRRRGEIDSTRSTEGVRVRSGIGGLHEGQHTTHYCVVDDQGTIVSTTTTLNDLFGCKVIVAGAGFFMNDEMDDFSAKPGVPNAYGLIGGSANAIEAEKRPLSSMTPAILLKDGKPCMVLGARGGSQIITAIAQVISNVADFGMNLQEAVEAPRFHHQWQPDSLIYERFALAQDVMQKLEEKGYHLQETDSPLGELEAIWFDSADGWIYGVPDPREGGVALGY
jgi:gamma-glutamyltranspeptidase / glutathione hydrolase